MISRYSVSLGGKAMTAISTDISNGLLILDIAHSTPEIETTETILGALDGYEVSRIYYKKRTVTISFELHIYDIAKRNKACQDINAWAANGGNLVVNDRSGQFLNVRCETFANIASARNWTDPLTLVFATDTVPFWQSSTENVKTLKGTNTSGSMAVSGNAGNAIVNISLKALAAVNNVTFMAYEGGGNVINNSASIPVGGVTYAQMANAQIARQLHFTGLGMANGQTLSISYINGRYLNAVVGNRSVLDCLHKDSYDSLLVPCGKTCTFKFQSSGNAEVTFRTRGLWL